MTRLPEVLRFSLEALGANKFRTLLTALGLVIGNAAVILVVTISITGREYVLGEIRAIGSNIIYASADTGANSNTSADADFIKLSDVNAVRQMFASRIIAATGVMVSFDRMTIGGKEEDIKVIGSDDQYAPVRNLDLLTGRFLDPSDLDLRAKVALLTAKLARRLFGSTLDSVGRQVKIHSLSFTVIGAFKERADSFGLSELSDETILIPVTVLRYFAPVERIDPLYVQAKRATDVAPLTTSIRQLIESRHRSGARYSVENLSAILDAARKVSLVLTIVLLLVAAIALTISGIGIMNIMLVTVSERTREIGLRMAMGASRAEILRQFLAESVLISFGGGSLGIILGAFVPLAIGLFWDGLQLPVSTVSVVIAFAVSIVLGVSFGLLPANRASRLSPTEALRHE